MKSFIFYFFNNWRAILNLWTLFIVGLLVIIVLKHKMDVNFKKTIYIPIICAYALLSIFAYYIVGDINLITLSNVLIYAIFFGFGIILYDKYRHNKLNKTVKYAAVVLLLFPLIDIFGVFVKVLIKLTL